MWVGRQWWGTREPLLLHSQGVLGLGPALESGGPRPGGEVLCQLSQRPGGK